MSSKPVQVGAKVAVMAVLIRPNIVTLKYDGDWSINNSHSNHEDIEAQMMNTVHQTNEYIIGCIHNKLSWLFLSNILLLLFFFFVFFFADCIDLPPGLGLGLCAKLRFEWSVASVVSLSQNRTQIARL